MSSKTNIFITGATGYIGGSVLLRLLDHPKADTFHITALVRSEGKAAKLRTLGIDTVIGSLSESDKLEKLASEADLVFSIADADDLGAAKAVLAGLKKRHEQTGTVPILIHTSGTGVFADMTPYETFYDDTNVEQMDALPITQLHRNVDLENVNADKEGYVKTYIIVPSTIYGLAKGRLVNMGVQNPHSIQLPYLIRACIDRGQVGMVGDGKNIWPSVDIEDVADLYLALFDAIMSDPSTGHGPDGYYIGENGDYSLHDACKAVGEALVDHGKSQTAEPTPFTPDECMKYFGGYYLGSTCRCRANHSRAIGWKPTKTTTDLIASLKFEVEALLDSKPLAVPDAAATLLQKL